MVERGEADEYRKWIQLRTRKGMTRTHHLSNPVDQEGPGLLLAAGDADRRDHVTADVPAHPGRQVARLVLHAGPGGVGDVDGHVVGTQAPRPAAAVRDDVDFELEQGHV